MNNVNNLVARMDAERKVAVAKAKLETSQQLAAMAAVAFFLGFATGREGALFLLGGQAFLFGIYVWKAKDDLRLAKWQNTPHS